MINLTFYHPSTLSPITAPVLDSVVTRGAVTWALVELDGAEYGVPYYHIISDGPVVVDFYQNAEFVFNNRYPSRWFADLAGIHWRLKSKPGQECEYVIQRRVGD